MITIEQLLAGTQGKALETQIKQFQSIGTDTRSDLTGKIFFALKGDQFDGHDFIQQALAAGAAAVVSHQPRPELPKPTTWIQVEDTLVALQKLAQYWRQQWGGKLIGITGSNGKTTVKDFTHTLLAGTYSALKNEGSFNNHWGLPLTLLKLSPEHQWGVVEMGMNHAGEITQLVIMAEPNVVTVTMVGTAHIEFFGSIDKIAQAKREIYDESDKGGVAVFNLNNPYTLKMHSEMAAQFAQSFTFGEQGADVFLNIKEKNAKGITVIGMIGGMSGVAETQVWGEQNIYNMMAASALALAAGVTPQQIWERLPLCEMGWGRNQWVDLKGGARCLFDGYNANPESFKALLDNISDARSSYSEVYGIFGEMRELGENSDQAHRELGAQVAQSSVDYAVFFGPSESAFRSGFESVKSTKKLVTSGTYKEVLAIEIKTMLRSTSLVVVKGSRGAQLERAVLALDPVDFKKTK